MTVKEQNMKTRILYAAKKLFSEQGFDKTSVREICEVAGANIALVSYYYGGKEKLLKALFEHFVPINEIRDLLKDVEEPVEWLNILIQQIVKFKLNDVEMARLISHENALSTERVETYKLRTSSLWADLKEKLILGKEQGVFQYRDINITIVMIIGILLHNSVAMYNELIDDKNLSLNEHVKSVKLFVYQALGMEIEMEAI
ncbi:TetR family transcriptional regulator [Longirhabdus pacifica]|uniref:TetR family transcriptional regulator n=1 Tax=Longirhabdus pacifica TaxID=2305227 RepID=UPI0013E8E6F0|nr:TetR family transcriptional regulator [Longirhabdus pacifica]